jgi:cathepsin L
MEGRHQIATGDLVSLSEQQLVDCSSLNHGCNGGSMALAMSYTKKNGLELESEYPYTGKSGLFKKCNYDASLGKVHALSHKSVKSGSADQLKAAIAQGPVSVAIEADQLAFQLYKGGVLTKGCGTNLDHGVLAVGYDTDATTGEEYFLVKNSWAATWGDNGYIKLGVNNVCGILNQPVYPATD